MLGNRFLIQLLSAHPDSQLTSGGRAPQLRGPIGVPGYRFHTRLLFHFSVVRVDLGVDHTRMTGAGEIH
jgi:hypothetical protein